MANTLTFLTPAASLTWPDGPVSPDFVSVEANMNRHLRVKFTAFSGEKASEGVTPVLASGAAELMGRCQRIAFTSRSTPDCSVTLEDGRGGTLDCEGFLASPSYQMDRRQIRPLFEFVGASSVMESLKLDIYTPRFSGKDGESAPLSTGRMMVQDEVKDPNLANRLSSLTDKLVRRWLDNRATENASSLSAALKDQRHASNMAGPLDAWKRLLANSAGDLDNEWLPRMADNPAFNSGFNNELVAILRGMNGGFGNVLASLMGAFQMVMVPSRDGGPGRLIYLDEMLFGEPEDLVLSSDSVFLAGGDGSDLLPVQQVLMRGIPVMATMLTRDRGAGFVAGEGMVVGGFPAEGVQATGGVEFVSAPFYLEKIMSWFSTKDPEGSGPASYEKLKAGMDRLVKLGRSYRDSMVNKMVTDYCRCAYVDRALGASSSSITMPADLSLWPGKRYRVRNPAGDELFTGFLSGVNHNFVRGRGIGNASTTLNFGHITFTGFSLPGT